MCYYNGTKVTRGEYLRLKHLERLVAEYDFLNDPLYIGTNYIKAPVMRRYPKKEDFELALKDWGMIPPTIQSDQDVAAFRLNFMTLNAKAENLFVSETGGYSMFAEAAMERRCLVPSTHFFERRHVQLRGRNGRILKKTIGYPYLIKHKTNNISYFAGVWNPNDKRGSNYAIVTTAATTNLGLIHNTKKRMPTILSEELAWEWLFGNLKKNRVEEIARFQKDESEIEWYTVDKDFLNCADPMKEVLHPEMPPLGVDIMPSSQIGLFE